MTNPGYSVKVKSSEFRIWKGKEPELIHLDMELTERCNNNCVHCYINLPVNDVSQVQELSTMEVERILKEATDLGALSVRFTGGEPLIRDDFQEIYLSARKLGLRVILFTNACLMTQELVNLFSRVPLLEKIEVTVYGLTRESYEAVTRMPGSYERFCNGLNLLFDAKIPFVVKGAFLPQNHHELDLFYTWASTIPAMTKSPGYSMFFDLRARRDSGVKNEMIKRLRPTPDEYLSFVSRNRRGYIEEMKEFCSKFIGNSGDTLFSCGAGKKVCVDAYGLMQPCLLLRHQDLVCDVRKNSVRDALTFFSHTLPAIKARNPLYLSRCARCFLKGFCEQCPAKSWMEHGNLDTPVEYLCQVAHVRALDLGLLRNGEKAWEVTDSAERIKLFIKSR